MAENKKEQMSHPMPPKSPGRKIIKIVCSTSNKADSSALIRFQGESAQLMKDGVSAYDIVREWNDCQENFYNKAYLVETYQEE
jgi:hypothetical protein